MTRPLMTWQALAERGATLLALLESCVALLASHLHAMLTPDRDLATPHAKLSDEARQQLRVTAKRAPPPLSAFLRPGSGGGGGGGAAGGLVAVLRECADLAPSSLVGGVGGGGGADGVTDGVTDAPVRVLRVLAARALAALAG